MTMEHLNLITHAAGRKVHSIACGKGDIPFHFLHANGLCAGTYLPLFELLENDFTMLATDIPGHGDSAPHGTERIRHWDVFVDPVKDAIQTHMKPKVVGAGHSLGAVVTLLAAAKHPELFSHIILIDPVIFIRPMLLLFALARRTGLMPWNPLAQGARRRKTVFESQDEALRRFTSGRGMFGTWNRPYIEAFCHHGLSWNGDGTGSLKCHPETEAQIYESILLDIWNYPPKISCPALIIRGERSNTFTAPAGRAVHRNIRNSSLVTVPDTTHFVPMENPEACRRAIMNFLSENR